MLLCDVQQFATRRFNSDIVECKFKELPKLGDMDRRFNSDIVECK